jgi:hypothetical protein
MMILQNKLTSIGQTLSHTPSLEVILGIASKALKLHFSLQKEVFQALSNLQTHLQTSLELIRSANVVHYTQELSCPDQKGIYFFERFHWQKSASRVCLLLYYLLSTVNFTAKLGFIQIERIGTIWLYILSRFFTAFDKWRSKEWDKMAISLAKIATILMGFVITSVALQAISLSVDCIDAHYKGIL